MKPFVFAMPGRPVHSLFFHCSASDRPEHDDVSVIRDWHVRGNGWQDVGYHFYIKRDGTIQRGRSLEMTPAAQGNGFNAGTIAVCLGGLTKAQFTPAQFEAGYSIVRAIVDAYERSGITIRVRGHREVYPKECPVFDYHRAFGLDADGYPVGRPDFSIQDDGPAPNGGLGRDLYLMVPNRDAEVKALQAALNARGAKPSLDVDGVFGRATLDAVAAWQARSGLESDGIAGAKTRASLGLPA